MFSLDSGEPFGLPKGTVRGIIALVFLGLLGYDFVVDQAFTTEMVAVAGPYLGFYFGTRGSEPTAMRESDGPLPPPALGDGD